MRRGLSPLLISLLTLLVIVALVFGARGALRQMPSRHLSRFPKFVQTWVIPEPDSATLPVPEGYDPDAPVVFEETEPVVAESDAVALAPVIEDPMPTPTLIDEAMAPAATPPPAPTDVPVEAAPIAEVSESQEPLVEPTAAPPPLPTYHRITNIQHHQQDWNNCGPATLAMALSTFGESFTQYDTAAILKPNPEDRNVTPTQMAAFVNDRTAYSALERVNGSLALLKTLVANDFPVIIEVGLDPPGEVAWLEWYGHYLLAVGYDDSSSDFWVFDSLIWDAASLAESNSPLGRSYRYEDLLTYWPQFNRTYIVLYEESRAAELQAILGNDADLIAMWQRSLEVNQAAVQNQPDNAFLWFNVGSSYNSLGQHDKAVEAFDRARSIGLPWRMLWYQFGPYEAYYNAERYLDVVQLANITLDGRPYFEESFLWRGLSQQALGDVNSARRDFQSAIDFNPYFEPAQNALNTLDAAGSQ